MSEMTLERLEQMRGATVYDSAGEKIGSVEEIFYDERRVSGNGSASAPGSSGRSAFSSRSRARASRRTR